MDRRTFIKSTALSSIAFAMGTFTPSKTHILTLSFDDGFVKSFYRIAEIYENYDLSACLNVIASGHLPEFQQVDNWILPELMGDFDDWNALQSRGHEIMPHSWKHLNLAKQPLEEAQDLIIKCLDYFEIHLEGFDASKSVFNFPFNSSTPELEAFTLSKCLALRSNGQSAINKIDENNLTFRQSCKSFGPENIDHWVENQINAFLDSSGGWLILNCHGLDKEGWGPMSTSYLDQLLKRLVDIEKLEILPTGNVLHRSLAH